MVTHLARYAIGDTAHWGVDADSEVRAALDLLD